MKLAGLQKLTLLDYPEKTACTVFIAGCNFACPYCYNVSLIKSNHKDIQTIGEDEFFSFLQNRRGLLDGVCISGGEPLMYGELNNFTAKIKEMGLLVKIDTNGCYPDLLKKIVKSGNVDYVAMDIKNSLEKYPETTGIPDYDTTPVMESVKYLLSGTVSYEFRTTVVRDFHTKEDMLTIANSIIGADRFYLQSFDNSKEALCKNLTAYNETEMKELCKSINEILPCAELRGF